MLFGSRVFQLCVWSGDGHSSPLFHCCVFPHDFSFTHCQCCSHIIFMLPCLCCFLSPSSEGVHSPSLRCLVLCSTCSLLSSRLCNHLSICWCLCLFLASFLILHPSLHDGITTCLYYYALKNMRLQKHFHFVEIRCWHMGHVDRLVGQLSWQLTPSVSLFIRTFSSHFTPHLTHSD